MSDIHLNTFAILILTKDREAENPRYEYYKEPANLLVENRLSMPRSSNSEYLRYASAQNDNQDVSDDSRYWIKVENGKAYVFTTNNVISNEEIDSTNFIGPFNDESEVYHYLSEMNLEIAQ